MKFQEKGKMNGMRVAGKKIIVKNSLRSIEFHNTHKKKLSAPYYVVLLLEAINEKKKTAEKILLCHKYLIA